MKVWTADELMALTPAQRQAIFDENTSTDLGDIPPSSTRHTSPLIQTTSYSTTPAESPQKHEFESTSPRGA